MFEKEEHDGRAAFHTAIHEHDSGLPDGYSPMNETVYTDSPTFVSEHVDGRRAMIKVSFREDDSNAETSILTCIEKEQETSFEYNLLNRTVVDNPQDAAEVMIEQLIPDLTSRLED